MGHVPYGFDPFCAMLFSSPDIRVTAIKIVSISGMLAQIGKATIEG